MPTVVQSGANEGFGTAITCCSNWTGSGSVTTGDVLYVETMAYSGGATLPAAPTAPCVATWVSEFTGVDSQLDIYQISAGVATGTGSCTVTVTGSGSSGGINIAVWDAANVTTTKDGTCGTSYSATGSGFSGASVTTSAQANDLVLTALKVLSSSLTATTSSPFVQDFNGNANTYFNLAHYIQPSTGAVSATWTPSGFAGWYSAVCALKP